uniref:hypothetical protein n=1 Tax=Sinorhizobium medicae TaxID=110321 RepID=UPI00358DBECA
MPSTTTYAPTGNAYIDGLLGDWKWAVKDFTFSFPTSASFYGSGYGNGEPQKGFAALNAAQQTTARAAFDQFSSVAKVSFTEIAERATKHADVRLASSDAPSTAWAYFPCCRRRGRVVQQLVRLLQPPDERKLRLCDIPPRDRPRAWAGTRP